jgi:hypothetical protein
VTGTKSAATLSSLLVRCATSSRRGSERPPLRIDR